MLRGSLTNHSINITGFRVHFWSRFWKLDLKKRYGQWVMITGATDGIGLSYAREFAKRGHSLILLGRNQEKLDKVKLELKKLLPEEKIVLICADLSTATSETYKDVAAQIKGMERDIGILFNNAGVMLPSPNRFLDQPESSLWQHCSVNIAGVLMVTRCVLPGMCKRKRGIIINMSSMAAMYPMPTMGVYSASKKFVESFSKSLEYEYSSYGIEVQTLIPSYIATKMVNWSKTLSTANLFTPDSETFAKSAIGTIGRSSETTGYWTHGIQHWANSHFVCQSMWNWACWFGLKSLDTSKRSR